MGTSQRVFIASYVNENYVGKNKDQLVDRVETRVESIKNHLIQLHHESRGRMFNNAVILHPTTLPAQVMADQLQASLAQERIKVRTAESDRAYVLGNNPQAVDAPRGWLLRGANEALGEDWQGSPLIALTPAAAINYIEGTYDSLDWRQPVVPSERQILEITDETHWPVAQHQAVLEQRVLASLAA
jgi:hypothetical protein